MKSLLKLSKMNCSSYNKFKGLFGLNTFVSKSDLINKCDLTLDYLYKKLNKAHKSQKVSSSYIELMDEISNELCILIDGSTAISLLYEDPEMKDASQDVITKVSNFMDKLNKNKLLFDNLVKLQKSANSLSNEGKVLLDRMIYELSIISKEENYNNDHSINPDTETLLFEKLWSNNIINDFLITKDELKEIKSIGLKSYLIILIENNQKEEEISSDSNNDHYIKADIELLTSIIKSSNVPSLTNRAMHVISSLSISKMKYFTDILKIRLKRSKILLNNVNNSSYSLYKLSQQSIVQTPQQLLLIITNLSKRLLPNIISKYKILHYFNKENNIIERNSNKLKHNDIKYIIDKYIEKELSTHINSTSELDRNVLNNASKDYITIQNALNGMIILSSDLFSVDLEFILDEDMIQEMFLHKSVLKCIVRKRNDIIVNYEPKTIDVNSPSFIHNDDNFIEIKEISNSETIGTIYFDLFVREGKNRTTFSHLTVQGSKLLNKHNIKYDEGSQSLIRQKPISIIATNFEVSSLDLINMSISFNDCKDLFHEFGHAMHSILSLTEYQSLSGTRIPLDFAEFPSHFMEKYIFDYDFCKRFMIDRNYNKVLPQELHNILCLENTLFEELYLQETIYTSINDIKLHSFTKEEEITEDSIKNILKRENFYINHKYNIFNDKFFEEFDKLYTAEDLKVNRNTAYYEFQKEFINTSTSTTPYVINTKLEELLNKYKETNLLIDDKERDEYYNIFSSHLSEYPSCYYSYIVGKIYSDVLISKLNISDNFILSSLIEKEFFSKGFNQSPIKFFELLNNKI